MLPAWWNSKAVPAQAIETRDEVLKLIPPAGHWRNGVFLYGPPGTCKTSTACAVLEFWRIEGWGIRFEDFAGFMIRLRSSWRKDAEVTQEKIFDALISPTLLCIDEVGKTENDIERSALADLVNLRINAGHPTILTANLDLSGSAGIKEASKVIDVRVLERFRGCFVAAKGANLRKEPTFLNPRILRACDIAPPDETSTQRASRVLNTLEWEREQEAK